MGGNATIGTGDMGSLVADRIRAAQPNSVLGAVQRLGGIETICEDLHITGTGSLSAKIYQLHGSIRVLDQWALITEVTTLTNATGVYGDLWDGTVSKPITAIAPGAVLSGFSVGSYMGKDQLKSASMTVADASECQVIEASNRFAQPFTIMQKTGDVDTFVRLNLTTTDSPIDFKATVYFLWKPLDGGYIEVVTP
jgi:hypothetical protein